MKKARALWVTYEGVEEYVSAQHIQGLRSREEIPWHQRAYKFMYWRDGGDEQPLLIVGGSGLDTHHKLFHVAGSALSLPAPMCADGAGDVDTAGFILSWMSAGFNIVTPNDLIDELTGLLGVNVYKW